jgi:hypothetical protein
MQGPGGSWIPNDEHNRNTFLVAARGLECTHMLTIFSNESFSSPKDSMVESQCTHKTSIGNHKEITKLKLHSEMSLNINNA